jgi:dolichol-phosphate mannosyltransferase
LIVLPTYNEAENIERVLRRIRSAVPGAGILVVDDGSPDGTAEIGEGLREELGDLYILRRAAKAGLGSAYRAGFAWGLLRGYDAFVEMDSDLSHEPEALPGLLSPLSQGFDLVVGSRYVPGGSIPNWRLHRRLLSQGGNIYASVMLGLHVTDSTSGFRAYNGEILEKIDLGSVRADGYGFQIEMVHRVLSRGGNVTEVPIRFVDRVEGKSKMSAHIVVEALLLVTWWAARRFANAIRAAAAPAAGRRRSWRRPQTSSPVRTVSSPESGSRRHESSSAAHPEDLTEVAPAASAPAAEPKPPQVS